MAILQRYTAAEALNTTTSGIWTVKGRLTINASSGAVVSTLLSENAHSIIIVPALDIYMNFAIVGQAISTTNDLRIAGDTDEEDFISITVPRGLGNTIYFNAQAVADSGTTCRLIEV